METSVCRVPTPEEQIFDNDTSTEEHGSSNLKQMRTISDLEDELKKTKYSVQEYAEYNAWMERKVAEFEQNKLAYERRVKKLEAMLAQERQEKHQIQAEFDEFQKTCCARNFSTPSPTSQSRSPFSSSLSSPTYPSSLQSMTSLWHSDSNWTPCSSSPSSSQIFPTMQLGLFQPFADQEEENSNEQVCCRCNACYWPDFESQIKSKFGAVGDGRPIRKTPEELAHFVAICEKIVDSILIESSTLNESAR